MQTQTWRAPHGAAARVTVLERAAAFLGVALVVTTVGCGARNAPAAERMRPPARGAADVPAVLATIGSTPITMTDIRAEAGDKLDALDIQYRRAQHALIQTALDSILRRRVLGAEAQKQGKTIDQLVAAEVGGNLDPSEAEIGAWYVNNHDRVGTRTLDQIRPQIAQYLHQQKQKEGLQKLQDRLYREKQVAVKLEPFRVEIEDDGAPRLLSQAAPVTLVEFSDFQCPYCGAMFPTLKRVEQTFGKQVQVVYRQFPLSSIHPYAFKAAEASLCANEQGKFWAMHDLMFQEQSKLTVTDLKDKAVRLGLDQKKFDRCLDTGRYVEQVEKDQTEGSRLGVNGTPALFINGMPVDGGAVPYEQLAQAINDELGRVKR